MWILNKFKKCSIVLWNKIVKIDHPVAQLINAVNEPKRSQ